MANFTGNQYTTKKDFMERLIEKTVYENECWLYTGAPGRVEEYDAPRIWDDYDGKQHPIAVVAYRKLVGPIKRHMCILHTCDHARCWNPLHLYQGTKQQNTNDMIRRGRHVSPRGEASGMAVLTTNQVIDIKIRLKRGGSTTVIARKLGIKRKTVDAIKHGISWKHIEV